MAKRVEFHWQLPVPEKLTDGEVLHRVDEDGSIIEENCLVKVDKYGFFIYWTSASRDGQVIDCSQISDIRSFSPSKACETSDSKILCICSGLDFVNVSYTYFAAQSEAVAESWCKDLRSISHNYKANNVCPTTQLQKHWLKLSLMVNQNGKIPVRSITRTFASGKTEKMVMQALEGLGLPGGKNDAIETLDFTFEKFIELYHKICPRTDIEKLFEDLSKQKRHLTATNLMEFLNETQRDPRLNEILSPFYNRDRVLELIRRYETNPDYINREWISLDAFCCYLMSDENAPMFLDRLDIYQEMEQPLSHYYINSSHNTYLVGRQFGGRSSVEMYRQVLIAGCRCIELDCWDGPGGEPIITHGKAMCTDISFYDVIKAIKETAFLTSEYPVILSFENHCTKPQQRKLALYCMEVFGDALLKEPLSDIPLKPGVPLPSPNQLKGKILIKNKKLKPEVEHEQLERYYKEGRTAVEMVDNSSNGDSDDLAPGDVNGNIASSPSLDVAHPEQEDAGPLANLLVSESQFLEMKEKHDAEKEVKSLKMVDKLDNLTNEDESQLISNYRYESATTNIHPLLSSLVNYVQPVKFQGFDVAEERSITQNMSSFNENTGLGLLKNHAIEFVNYNKRQLSRIYPKGGRVESSNYMPQIFWNAGCQMVSLNFQTSDLAMQLNQGKFEYNGNCGYLLKPDFMRRPDREFDPFSECPVDGVIAAHCSVQVISGQFLSDKKVGTYVEVDMFGLPTDTIRKENRTKVVPNNGLNPVYGLDSEPFVFRKIVLPDLAVLRIGVYEESGKLIGQRILPLDGLQAGYRHISLRTEGNFPLSLPTVFCKIVLKTYIPAGLNDLVDALSEPQKFPSQAQPDKMVVEEAEIGEVSDEASDSSSKKTKAIDKNSHTDLSSSDAASGTKLPASQRDMADVKCEPVSLETIRQSRDYTKLCKQHLKEHTLLKKKHQKEKILAQKAHTSKASAAATESANRKSFKRKGSSLLCHRFDSASYRITLTKSRSESEVQMLSTCPELEKTDLWKGLVSRQAEEEAALRKLHVSREHDVLQQILISKHDIQCKELNLKQEREMKELSTCQTKESLSTKKQFATDKSIKSKAEAERRMKEINENNTKKFGSERQLLKCKHEKQLKFLKKFHEREYERIKHLLDEEKSSYTQDPNSEMVEKIETVI
ncbi:1-phosphatidylinositol 4,5-bisphosphate phosphodiesterase beta-4-like [Watersipora subatra]|uniref:1-phosphatidylinositol 4,5-bisphosphate phosphodiesterase beta-4-like n=1 Tax=Watersipora subatra TaxID=2589382 RepID=UPI00355B39F6